VLSVLSLALLVCGVFGLLEISSVGKQASPAEELITGSIQQSSDIRRPAARNPMATSRPHPLRSRGEGRRPQP